MKKAILTILVFSWPTFFVLAQKKINDEAIRFQQERMVFKQWDSDKFKPSSGLFGLNPLYWLTWAWHSDYAKHDLRPLGPSGPQTQRLALVAAMQNVEEAYSHQADTLRQSSSKEIMHQSGLLSDTDPLWLLYYQKQFEPLLKQQDQKLLDGMSQKEKDNIKASKLMDWYIEESHSLAERLNGARTTTLERGSRLLAYQRLLDEYRKLQATWETKKQKTRWYLQLSESNANIKTHQTQITRPGHKTDVEIADDILRHSKL
jgi:hypothetical protein